jgi:formylglycine-generating enzyme
MRMELRFSLPVNRQADYNWEKDYCFLGFARSSREKPKPMPRTLAVLLAAALCLFPACSRQRDEVTGGEKGNAPPSPTETEPPGPAATAKEAPPPGLANPPGMVWIPGGRFEMGCESAEARADEGPVHVVELDGFYMDITEVTNRQFAEFVAATGYVTTAESAPRPEDLGPEAANIDPEKLVPGAAVFQKTATPTETRAPDSFLQWWHWTPGAQWRHPLGPGLEIDSFDDHPVVQVSWHDAVAYCEWAGKQLPTEAQWERAARGGLHQKPYVWGDEKVSDANPQANIWQGQFPFRNAATDGYEGTAPVRSFPPNGYGLYDMAGNVWEWCGDWYRADYYNSLRGKVTVNPTGPSSTDHPVELRRVHRGGSFLCHRDYCSSYRPSARMSNSVDTGTSHTGFRCVMSLSQWQERNRPAQ